MDAARRATVADRAVVLDTLVRAFPADPMVRWFFPDDLTYPARAAAFFGHLFDIRVDHGGIPAFLETATPENIPFYSRFGFEELANADLPEGPTVRGLWRAPRT